MDQPILSQARAGFDTAKIVLRHCPPPYRAMVAICSDIDQTRIDVFREIHRFMNTREETCIGRGVGLDIADSLWMYKSPHSNVFRDNLAYFTDYGWTRPGPYADELMDYARAGWIDTLHTYGNFNLLPAHPSKFTREHAIHALDILEKNGVELRVWVNHGGRGNRQNIGDEAWYEGDDPESSAYHLDFLKDYGTEYIWSHAGADQLGAPSVVSARALRDGARMFGFPRLTIVRDCRAAAHLGKLRGFGYSEGAAGTRLHAWLPQALALQLGDEALGSLVEQRHLCVFAQHLGALAPMTTFDREMAAALRRLRRWQDDGLILVARTSRLLHYNRVRDHLRFKVVSGGDRLVIDIEAVEDPVRGRWLPELEDLRGVTFTIEARPGETDAWPGQPVALFLGGEPIAAHELATRHEEAGCRTIGIRWFEADAADYAMPFLVRERTSYLLWSRPAGDRAAADATRIVAALQQVDDVPQALQNGPGRSAVAAAIGGYGEGLAAATRALEQIGFTELRDGLDLGSGAGEWCLAFLRHSQRAVGIEPSAQLAAVARLAAERLGCAERVRFLEQPVEAIEPGGSSFDCAWCRSALTHADAETVLSQAGQRLGHNRSFYCSFAGEGQLLCDLGAALFGAAPEQAATPLGDLLAGYLRRCGVGRVPGSPRRLLDPDELLRACRTLGFSYLGQPGVHDGAAAYLGIPANFDLLVRKTQDPAEARAALLAAMVSAAPLAELELIAQSGCPGIVCDVLMAADTDRATPAARALLVRALIRAGRGGEDIADRLCHAAPLPPLTQGLYRHDRGEYARALKCYNALAADHPDKPFLIGSCHLDLRRWGAARRVFARAAGHGASNPREWVGLMAAHFNRADYDNARRAFRGLVASRPNAGAEDADIGAVPDDAARLPANIGRASAWWRAVRRRR